MTRVKTAMIIGGGIAGPVTAAALGRAGIEATVYEAYADTASADAAGGVLNIAPNGLDALRVVGAEDAVCAIGQPTADMAFENGRGRRLGTAAGLSDLPPTRTVRRADLHRVLHEHAISRGIRIEHGKRLVGVREAPTGVTAEFDDGTTASADILIGADGIRSTVRTLIDPAAPEPRYVGLLGFGVGDYVPGDGDPKARPSTMHFAFGKRSFFGYWTQSDGSIALFCNLPHEPITTAEARAIPAQEWLRRLREAHRGDVPAERVLREATADSVLVAGPMELMPPLPRWHRDRLVLVGDSAHAPSSSSGQGASLAMESGVQLARCLRDIDDPTAAFAAYERLRRPRTEKIAADAAKTNADKSAGPVAKAMMGLLMPIMTRTFLTSEKMFGFAQRHHIDWDAPVIG
ncbi:FAD-dependent oxidoreductase [Embleya scabrispora]|uniref:FAD-dependent oxidoreductase n=1 Tax=Embleya scabrispora TaxID=159449 RepID=UPI00035F4F5E|nr:FAD-dependent monooxygenase [Embleya scabrispora]MYS83542.1 FAD-dependent monooxygenase [Streptomyces sp. SID5474]